MNKTPSYKIPPPGKRISIGEVALHAYQLGEGKPTVVFENGLGVFALQWAYIQAQMAQSTHTLSYDRAGQGWSDLSPQPRTPQQLTAELHQLLSELQLSPPYVLVAHSFGGLISRYYARQYPDQLQGMVLVDTSHERQLEKVKDYQRGHDLMLKSLRVLSFLSRSSLIGQVISTQMFKRFRLFMSDQAWQQFIYLAGMPKYHEALHAEMTSFDQFFGQKNVIPTDLGDLPLIVVTAAESLLHERAQGGLTAVELNQAHQHNQAALARMSSRGRHLIVPGATHLSIVGNPAHAQYVIEAILQLL